MGRPEGLKIFSFGWSWLSLYIGAALKR